MRNILVHRYFAIDQDAVWEAVQDSLRDIKNTARRILADREQ
jgi:uncharacterized protein YutE (UPF0331/DUF86 family)